MATISPAVTAYLSLLAFSEGTSTSPITQNNGYDIIVSGVDGKHSFTDYSEHPFASGRSAIEVVAPGEKFPNGLYSTASGRYQFILGTWKGLAHKLGLTDFSPSSQDAACVEYLRQHGVVGTILAGNIEQAIETCGQPWGWASMPGSTAGQGGKSMEVLLNKYQSFST